MRLTRLLPVAVAAAVMAVAGASAASAAPPTRDFDFDGGDPAGTVLDGDGQATPFTSVVGTYDAPLIDLRAGQAPTGVLGVTATQGSNFGAGNTMKNGLDITFDSDGTKVIGARIIGSKNLTKSTQQAGVYLGPDQDNYVKLVATATGQGPRIQLAREINGNASTAGQVSFTAQEWADIDTLDVFLRADSSSGEVTADYVIDGGVRQIVTNTGDGLPSVVNISAANRPTFFGTDAHAGILAFTVNAPDVAVEYDWFRIDQCVATGGNPSVGDVHPEDGAPGVTLDAAVTAEVSLPNCGGIDSDTMNSDNARIIEDETDQVVNANVNTSGGGDVIVVQPVAALKPATTYRFEVTSGLKDISGASFQPFESTFTTGTDAGSFGNGDFGGSFTQMPTQAPELTGGAGYTSLTKGPDGKMYALGNFGRIYRFDIAPDGDLTNVQNIDTILNSEGQRILIGLAFDPASTPENPILWVSHNQATITGADEWTGKLTRLSGANLQNKQDVLTNLPRSARDHMTNSLAFHDGKLYFNQGSNSAMGAPDNGWSQRPERMLTGAVLVLDPAKLPAQGQWPVNVQTVDAGGPYDPTDPSDPDTFLSVYASGVRNAYDLVWHSNGQLYVPTNGSAAGGSSPGVSPGSLPDACERRIDDPNKGPGGNDYTGPGVQGLTNIGVQHDFLFRVTQHGYYGHPNPTRCEWVLNGGDPTAGEDENEVAKYDNGTLPDRNYKGDAFDFGLHYSPNGATEYTNATAFGGTLKGTLLVTRFSAGDDLILLTPDGPNGDIATWQTGVPGLSGLNNPLDVAEDPATGNLYVIEYPDPSKATAPSRILLLKPNDINDATAPSVTGRTPAPGATGVATGTNVTVDFSEGIDGDSVNEASASITPDGGSAVAAQRSLGPNTRLTIDPAAALTPGTRYTVRLSGITDGAGNVMPDVAWSFTTAGTAPGSGGGSTGGGSTAGGAAGGSTAGGGTPSGGTAGGQSAASIAAAPRCATPSVQQVRRFRGRLSERTLIEIQRNAQDALRRVAAIQGRLKSGLGPDDLCGGGFAASEFVPGIGLGTGAVVAQASASPKALKIGKRPTGFRPSGRKLTARQLLINQRVAQAAVRRVNALEKRLNGGLTGSDLAPGALTSAKLAPGLVVTAKGGGPAPASNTPAPVKKSGKRGKVVLSAAQVQINERISAAALRRANRLVAKMETGLAGRDFQDASISAREIS